MLFYCRYKSQQDFLEKSLTKQFLFKLGHFKIDGLFSVRESQRCELPKRFTILEDTAEGIANFEHVPGGYAIQLQMHKVFEQSSSMEK